MLRKLTAALLCLLLFFAVGCHSSEPAPLSSVPSVSSEAEPVTPAVIINPLTGCAGLAADKLNTRPVAIMINNINIAQSVQSGLNDADIIYETEVEGGITRLMAVYQDVTRSSRIGTIRSCRYPYIDLAMGHNAIYIHCGQDNTYAKPHLSDLDDVDINEGNYGMRVANGKTKEHTLYTNGTTLWNGLTKDRKTQNTKHGNWQNFAEEGTTVTLAGGICNTVAVPFSNTYRTSFTYDASSGKYTRLFNGNVVSDYLSGEATTVKNVFVLMTSITNYSDGYHRKVALSGGTGYYITNGTYAPIKWSKGNASSPFTFTNEDGSALQVSAGDSWVCIANTTTSKPTLS